MMLPSSHWRHPHYCEHKQGWGFWGLVLLVLVRLPGFLYLLCSLFTLAWALEEAGTPVAPCQAPVHFHHLDKAQSFSPALAALSLSLWGAPGPSPLWGMCEGLGL